MKNLEKHFRRTVLAASIAAIGISNSPVVSAQGAFGQDSAVEVGAAYVSDDSYKFGDYGRALQGAGGHLFSNVQMNTRGENNSYANFTANNLGMDTNWGIGLKLGQQGNYGFRFKYDQFSKLHSDSFQSPYEGLGTPVLTQPAGIVDGPNTAGIAGLAASMKKFNVDTKRVGTTFGATKQLAGGWDVAMNFKHEDKDGSKLTGAPIQIGTQGSRGTLLAPEPIDYSTNLLDVAGRYAGENLQAQVGYHSSVFRNATDSLTWDNLFSGTGNATGRLGQMPDNQFHQISASAGYSLSRETRLNGTLSVGRSTQNEAFLPYSTGGTMPATTSLNGRVDTTHADVKLNSKLTHDLHFTAGYKHDDRDNKTPINTYAYITADRDAGGVGASNTRTNTPLSKTQQQLYADVDYHLAQATTLKLGYDFDKITHTFEPTAGDKEHTVKAEVRHSFGDMGSGGLAYAHSDRKADPYDGSAPLYNTYTAAYLASLCVAPNTFVYNGAVTNCTGTASATSQATMPFLDTPALRKFFLTDRKRDKVRAYASLAPIEKLDLQVGGSYYRENYPEAETGFGLAKARGFSVNLDANLAATETLSGVFFTTFENYKTHQNAHNGASCTAAGSASCAPGTVITTLDRQNNTAAFDPLTGIVSRIDRSLTMGLGLRFKPEENYELGGDVTRITTRGETNFLDIGSRLLGILPVPDSVSTLNRLELYGKYKVKKDVTVNLKYMYEKYDSTDWAWDGQGLTSSTSFIGSEQTSADYRVSVIAASVTWSLR